jgi:hypothetical protein
VNSAEGCRIEQVVSVEEVRGTEGCDPSTTETEMLSNSNAYEAEIQYRRQQLHKDLARRQQVKQAKLARHNRDGVGRARKMTPLAMRWMRQES